MAKAYVWQKWLEEGVVADAKELAAKVGLDKSVVNRYLRLMSLSPAIVERFMGDKEPLEIERFWGLGGGVSREVDLGYCGTLGGFAHPAKIAKPFTP